MTTVPPSPFTVSTDDFARGVAKLTGRWWVVAALGVAVAVLGVLLLADLAVAVETVAVLVAIGMLVEGVAEIATADRGAVRWPSYVLGALWLVIGVVTLVWPAITLLALAVWIGAGFAVGGVFQVVGAIRWRATLPLWGVWLTLGVLTFVAGVLAMALPGLTVLFLAAMLGVTLLVRGIGMVWFGFELRKVHVSAAKP